MRSRTLVGSAILMLPFVLAAAPALGAELYKWVDERGVTNYSSETPPKGRTAKKLEMGGERFSVYTPDPQLTQAVEAERQKRSRPAPRASVTPPPAPPPPQVPLQQASPEPRVTSYDPCLMPGNPDCSAYVYDSSPLFYGRRRFAPLVQPQLPQGAIAGNVNEMKGTTPGLSGVTPPAATTAAPPSPSYGLKRKVPKDESK